jgi:hypothetical protein
MANEFDQDDESDAVSQAAFRGRCAAPELRAERITDVQHRIDAAFPLLRFNPKVTSSLPATALLTRYTVGQHLKPKNCFLNIQQSEMTFSLTLRTL